MTNINIRIQEQKKKGINHRWTQINTDKIFIKKILVCENPWLKGII